MNDAAFQTVKTQFLPPARFARRASPPSEGIRDRQESLFSSESGNPLCQNRHRMPVNWAVAGGGGSRGELGIPPRVPGPAGKVTPALPSRPNQKHGWALRAASLKPSNISITDRPATEALGIDPQIQISKYSIEIYKYRISIT